MHEEHYRLLQYLDKPLRLAFWTLDEAFCIFVPLLSGIFFDEYLLGIVSALSFYTLLWQVKRAMKKSDMKTWLYWYLPTSTIKIKKAYPYFYKNVWPCSHIRQYYL